ncbi:MFS transporter [Ancylobacter lacus]|uniref:MFS transporter n=1 Tax=Ancylobacter lacus TaxID=2579970 RepID=UPI001BCD93EF|nr:MFS transporter [Ancylobacter lacus]MBS7538989.1 hypothetical protein [Ancylobacter lacus]
MTLGSSVLRAGHLACACPEDVAGRARPTSVLTLSLGFALVTLAQALTLGALPLAGAMTAPRPEMAGWPTAAFLLGAACATLPALLLVDTFGRRAALAIGAGLGVAGGLAVAHALLGRAFPLLMVGAVWLGAAQGFGMFYRHAAAFGAAPGRAAGAVGRVLGAGALAGLGSPYLVTVAERLSLPYTLLGTTLLAAAAQLGALVFAVGLREARPALPEEATPAAALLPLRRLLLPSLTGAVAWAAMASSMVSVPIGLAGCGVAVAGISGIVAWHVVAMYGPALFAGRLAAWLGVRLLAGIGLAVTLAAAIAGRLAGEPALLTAALLLTGAGWAVTTAAVTGWLHEAGRLDGLRLAAHDGLVLAGAVAGAAFSLM